MWKFQNFGNVNELVNNGECFLNNASLLAELAFFVFAWNPVLQAVVVSRRRDIGRTQ